MKLISKSNKNGTICSIANLKNEAKLFLSIRTLFVMLTALITWTHLLDPDADQL